VIHTQPHERRLLLLAPGSGRSTKIALEYPDEGRQILVANPMGDFINAVISLLQQAAGEVVQAGVGDNSGWTTALIVSGETALLIADRPGNDKESGYLSL
jgi:hypothetical protein